MTEPACVTLGNFGETSGGFNGDGNDAASHVLGSGLYLGSSVDAELDGQASPAADGDDTNGLDDEDGVVFNGLITGRNRPITVTAAFNGVTDPVYLNAWIDFNQDGVWTANEQVLNDRVLADGENILTVNIPGDAEEGFTFARFRISTDAGLSFTEPLQTAKSKTIGSKSSAATPRLAAINSMTATTTACGTLTSLASPA